MTEINKKPYKAICFLQEDKGRDIEIVLPIVFAAERFLNCEIEFQLKWNAHLIYKNKPDFIILPTNCKGSSIYHRIAKYAHSQNVKIFSFVSEGNFNEKRHRNIYGFNTDKYFYQDYICAWSKRIQEFMKEKAPNQASIIKLTGAAGFDRFKIYKFGERKEFLARYGKSQFNKIVSYSGWAFGKVQYPLGQKELELDEAKRSKKIAWTNDQRIIVRDALRLAIENNPDTLFVLKQHPSEYYPGLNLVQVNEMSELVNYDNVIYIQGQMEGIHDVISIADIVLGFETTTAIETWILGETPTIFINSDPSFPRVSTYKGCLIAKNGEELLDYIHEFYEQGKIKEFYSQELIENRDEIISNSIGFKDGLNHLRHLKYLNTTLLKIDDNKFEYHRSAYFYRLYLFFKVMRPFYALKIVNKLPWFSKFNWVFERYKLSNLTVLQNKYKPYLDSFYAKNAIDEDYLINFWSNKIDN